RISMVVDTSTRKQIDDSLGSAWFTLSVEECFKLLDSTPNGLADADAARRLGKYGPNELEKLAHISPWTILLEQFKNILIIILLLATALSAFLGHGVEAIAITVIVLFAVVLGFVQGYRAERPIEALRKMAAPAATVIREGHEQRVPARDLVPGDLILLATGDKVPADVRLIEAVTLQKEGAALRRAPPPVE